LFQINVRDNKSGNKQWNWAHDPGRTQTKQKTQHKNLQNKKHGHYHTGLKVHVIVS